MPGHSRSPRQWRTDRRAAAGTRPGYSRHRGPAGEVDVDRLEHRPPDERVFVLHRLVRGRALPIGLAHRATLRHRDEMDPRCRLRQPARSGPTRTIPNAAPLRIPQSELGLAHAADEVHPSANMLLAWLTPTQRHRLPSRRVDVSAGRRSRSPTRERSPSPMAGPAGRATAPSAAPRCSRSVGNHQRAGNQQRYDRGVFGQPGRTSLEDPLTAPDRPPASRRAPGFPSDRLFAAGVTFLLINVTL